MAAEGRHRVVVVGGGFGGLYCAQALRSSPVDVTLVDRRNFHLFQPLLYQVATGSLSPANIAAPLRGICRRQKNLRVVLAEVTGFDTTAKVVKTADGDRLPYDTLVLATGSTHHYFGHDEWEEFAPGLKTVEDATEIRRKVLIAFEKAERETDPAVRKRLLTFVVIGGGPTGVEMAGSISELARLTMRNDFRAIDPATASVILVEGQPRVIPAFHEKLSAKAKRYLDQMGIEVVLDSHVTEVTADHIVVSADQGDAKRRIDTETLVWAAGVKASPLGKKLAEAFGSGVEVGKAGHVTVEPDCSVPGHPDVFVVGDMANWRHNPEKKPLPGVAQVAIQQGRYVSTVVHNRAKNVVPPKPFKYWDKGSMATVGRSKAVADVGFMRFGGFLAWVAWLFIHILFLAQFSNRLLVVMQWLYSYVSRGRSARLITGEHLAERTAFLERMLPPGPKAAEQSDGLAADTGNTAAKGTGAGAPATDPSAATGAVHDWASAAPK